MAQFIDSVPLSGIIRIRDMMYSVKDPFRLDQGDVSFDAPDTVKDAMRRAIDENRSHYVQTTGVPRLLELIAEKLRKTNGIPIGVARRGPGDDRRHPRALHPLPRPARAGRRGHRARSRMAAVDGQHQARPRRRRPVPAARAARVALRPRRARVEDHAADEGDLHQLAAQPHGRRPHAEPTSSASPPSPTRTASGSSRTRPTRTCSSTMRST